MLDGLLHGTDAPYNDDGSIGDTLLYIGNELVQEAIIDKLNGDGAGKYFGWKEYGFWRITVERLPYKPLNSDSAGF